jgi:serine/threonine-protein kinase RsbT
MHKVILTNDYLLVEYNFSVNPEDLEHAGEASSKIKEVLEQLKLDRKLIRRICIASYEAEINIAIHSYGGEIKLQIYPKKVIVTAEDGGPGIQDIDRALENGYSTASVHILKQGFGAGRGFSNMIRYSDGFNIFSKVGKGTKLEMHFENPAEIHGICPIK